LEIVHLLLGGDINLWKLHCLGSWSPSCHPLSSGSTHTEPLSSGRTHTEDVIGPFNLNSLLNFSPNSCVLGDCTDATVNAKQTPSLVQLHKVNSLVHYNEQADLASQPSWSHDTQMT